MKLEEYKASIKHLVDETNDEALFLLRRVSHSKLIEKVTAFLGTRRCTKTTSALNSFYLYVLS